MKHLGLYRGMVRLMPPFSGSLRPFRQQMPDAGLRAYQNILKRHRALGGALALFDQNGVTDHLVYGEARKGLPVTAQTAFRLASVSKLVSAAGILALGRLGLVDLECDADRGLPYTLRHPGAPERPITLRMLLSHTAGIVDGPAYFRHLGGGLPAGELLAAGCHAPHLPGEGCEYSNLGFGLAGCVVEAQCGLPFQQAMDRALFDPLGLKASYYAGLLDSPVADARRVLPPSRQPAYDGKARQAALPVGHDAVDLQGHYLLAHGNCCMDVESLARLGQALLAPGFFSVEDLSLMRQPLGSLAGRDPHLKQGLGMFILEDERLYNLPLYGHQGMAYGAVHMVFLDPARGRGILHLTVGASEAREHILADINRDLLTYWCRHE